jgi:flagellar biogenesis protein FliO
MTTVMIIGIVLMVARIVLRIGILLVVIWAGVRLFERFRTPRPPQSVPVLAPAMVTPTAELAVVAPVAEVTDTKVGA